MLSLKYLALNLLNFFTFVVEAILGLRFLMRLFGASATGGFASWIYEMSGTLLEPFRGVFPAKVFENRYVFEFSTLFAMMIYAIAALVLGAFIAYLTPDSTEPVVVKKRRI